MRPLFFGESSAPLFGIHHEPDAGAPRERGGVVLCAPFGREAIRAYRTFRQLALQLARDGFHVLRFDYRGAGDSAGDSTLGRPSIWLDDIRMAIDELRDIAGLRVVSLLGLRLGATLALSASAHDHRVRDLVLWQPIVRGADYLAELETTHRSRVGKSSGRGARASGTLTEALGFALSAECIDELRAIDACAVEQTRASRALVLEHSDAFQASNEVTRLCARLDGLRCPPTLEVSAAPHVWGERELEALVPAEVMRRIGSWLAEAPTA